MREIIVIGAGAAGLMAARSAALAGGHVTVLEHMEKAGRKIYITGKGRCNVTNDCTRDEFLSEVVHNPRFLYAALAAFSPQDMMEFLASEGCPTITERGRRVFPASQKASDVTKALEQSLHTLGVRLQLGTEVVSIETENGQVCGVRLQNGRMLSCDAVILATGGVSYPGTGSTGDGDRIAKALGHTLIPRLPSLSALETTDTWPMELQGLTLKNVTLRAQKGKKVLYENLGEMLFTHFGISGPLVLEMSCHLDEPIKDTQVSLCLKPALTPEQLDARLLREIQANPRKQLSHVLESMLPKRMAQLFPILCGLDANITVAQLTKDMRKKLVDGFVSLPIHLQRFRPITEAIVTRGGVSVREVDPKTMASKKVHGLFFAGEILDVDAHTGGYNLQIAFSTGFLAGRSAANL